MTNPKPRREDQRGASLLEYVMLLAFVAVIAIVGMRTVGPVAASLFDVDRLDLGPVATEVLGVNVEREITIGTAIALERPPTDCQPAAGAPVRPTCPL